jgi:hypothetical protein
MAIRILELALSGFWQFIGVVIILNGMAYFLVNGLIRIIRLFTRAAMVRKHGWPPEHLDADGDFRPEEVCYKDQTGIDLQSINTITQKP